MILFNIYIRKQAIITFCWCFKIRVKIFELFNSKILMIREQTTQFPIRFITGNLKSLNWRILLSSARVGKNKLRSNAISWNWLWSKTENALYMVRWKKTLLWWKIITAANKCIDILRPKFSIKYPLVAWLENESVRLIYFY